MSTSSIPIGHPAVKAAELSKPGSVPERLACVLCYLMGPVGGLTVLISSSLRHIWIIRFHAFHSLLMCALFILGWAHLRFAEALLPWFTSAILREIRLVAVIGSVPVWILAMVASWKGWRYAPIPLLHELAIVAARHFDSDSPAAARRAV